LRFSIGKRLWFSIGFSSFVLYGYCNLTVEICKRLREFEEIRKRLHEFEETEITRQICRVDSEYQGGKFLRLLSGFRQRIRPQDNEVSPRFLYVPLLVHDFSAPCIGHGMYFTSITFTYPAKNQYQKFKKTDIIRKLTARPQSQFFFHIHVSVSDLCIPTTDLPILLQDICGPILGTHKSLTDT
jgi:hypothetical protein